ncbi:MAG: tRNA lysidine(34) synthetase TilS [Flavobacteriales bacterium]|nr:tRNA lysidine(34) synthetase TilS [Flavobacteriales bacterium]
MRDRVQRTIRSHGLLPPAAPVWVAVSGGVDSMVLLHVLWSLGHPVKAVHIDHGLRGVESDADAQLVRSYCGSLGVPLVVERVDVKAHAATTGFSTQMAARALRYEVFKRCTEEGPVVLAMAHHADDAVETFFIQALQGMGARGRAGIPMRSGPFIRPLLEVDRASIHQYALQYAVPFREDASNRDPVYLRSRVRHELLPLLESMRAGSRTVMQRDMVLAREMDVAVQQQLAAVVGHLVCDAFGAVHVPRSTVLGSGMPHLVLHHVLHGLGLHPDRLDDMLQALEEGHVGARFPAGAKEVFVDRNGLVIAPAGQELPHWTIRSWYELPEQVPLRVLDPTDAASEATNGREVVSVDAEAIEFPLELRPWQVGDRMRPAGLGGSKLISDILVDAKVPLHRKRNAYVLISGGRIIWACGLRVAEGVVVAPGTPGAIILQWRGDVLVQ